MGLAKWFSSMSFIDDLV